MIGYYNPESNNEVVTRNDVNTQAGTVREDYPTPEEEQAFFVYEEDFRQYEAQNARDRAINSALSNGFVVDESTECYTDGCSCSRHQA